MISPAFGNLLRIFGTTCEHLLSQEMNEVIDILLQPTLASDTMEFCNHITTHYSFDQVFEAAIKRIA